MRFSSLGAAVLAGAAIVNPGMLVAAGVTYALGRMAAQAYRSEVAACDRLIKANYDGDPGNAANAAAATTASIVETLSIPSCGLSALALHLETVKMRRMRARAEATPGVVVPRGMRPIKQNLSLGY